MTGDADQTASPRLLPASANPGNRLRDQLQAVILNASCEHLGRDGYACSGCRADAVLAVLAEPTGDQLAQMAGTLLSHEWDPNLPNTMHERHSYSAACAICEGDVRRIIEVIAPVRWEHAAHQAATVERLLAENDELATELATERTEHKATIQRADVLERRLELAHKARRNAEDRLALCRTALAKDGYFAASEIGPDVAPRITERLSVAREAEAERDTLKTAEQRIRNAVIATYGEDYDGEDVAAEVERLLGHLSEYEANARCILQAKNEALEKAQNERDTLKAAIERVRKVDDYEEGCYGSVCRFPTAIRAALDTPETTENDTHVDRHGRSWDRHPFVQSRAVDNIRVCVCGQPPEHGIHTPETPGISGQSQVPAGGLELAVWDLAEAIRLTREYVGPELLPALEGWSWYDALKKHAPEFLVVAGPPESGDAESDSTDQQGTQQTDDTHVDRQEGSDDDD